MTTREFLNAVIDMANAADTTKTFGSINATPADFISAAETLTAKLDTRNEKRKSADTKEKKEVANPGMKQSYLFPWGWGGSRVFRWQD